MLRMESANQELDGRALPHLSEDARPKYRAGFGRLQNSPFRTLANPSLRLNENLD